MFGGGTVTFTNNTCTQVGTVSSQKGTWGTGIDVGSEAGTGNVITGNSITNVGAYLAESSVVNLGGGGGTFSNNTVSTDKGKYKAISAGSGWTVSNNTIIA